MAFDAVIFDWRGTLVTTLTEDKWVALALAAVGLPAAAARSVVDAIEAANGAEDRLDAPGVDSDASLHRATFMEVFSDARLQPDLAEALYALESDPWHNPFAADVAITFRALQQAGVRIAVLSDIHFDLRPVFADAGLLDYVDTFTLSFEQGVQKPDPLMFTRTAEALGIEPSKCLMVGDRSRPDGPAVEQGMTTLLLPPLHSTADRRLHHVLALCGLAAEQLKGGSVLEGEASEAQPAFVSVVLIVISGLPGVGKTTVARRIAERLRAVHLSVDAAEDGLLEAGLRPGRTTGVGAYEAVAAAARQNLSLGNDVVVDAVNDGDAARATWRRAAAEAGVELRFFVLLPPSEAEHQRRLRRRDRDHRHVQEPTWADVVKRARCYEPWADAAVPLDATASAEAIADDVIAGLGYRYRRAVPLLAPVE